jgi:hypothetical protein
MNEPGQDSGGGGWNVAKVLGLLVGLLGMAGFGFCGLCGIVLGVGSGGHDMGFILTCGIAGLVIAGVFFLLVRAMIRSARRRPPGAS